MKGGGRRKQWFTTLCLAQPTHGIRGVGTTHNFVKVEAPKSRKAVAHLGCPFCRAKEKEA